MIGEIVNTIATFPLQLNVARVGDATDAGRVSLAAARVPNDRQAHDPECEHIVLIRAEVELAQRNYAAVAADAQMAVEQASAEARSLAA